MRAKLAAVYHNICFDLRWRLMTALLVCVLPIAVVSCVLSGIVLIRTDREMTQNDQTRLEEVMSYWERDSRTIDRAMDYFLSLYLPQLSYSTLKTDDVTRYDMFRQISRILPEAEHNGLTALLDHQTGQVLAQMQDPAADAGLMDSQVRSFTQMLRSGEALEDRTWQIIDGRAYLLKRFDYRNYSIFFAMDAGNSIRTRIAPLCTEKATVYVADGEKTLKLTDTQFVETELTWQECTASSLWSQKRIWASDVFPIAVCIAENTTFLSRLPQGAWVLLAVVLVCLGSALHLPRLIRLEVLDPAQRLRSAMHEIQTGNLDYRLEDTNYRNSDTMQYLFDTFDEMADEVAASREKDQKMYQAEMDNLRLQVNPHMLLNSLNTIYSLAQMKKFEAIQEYSLHLVDYFRYALRRNDNLVTVEQELEFIKTYMEIQKIRYPGLLSFVYAIDDDCICAKVPPLLIQNFVENSVKYAVKPGKLTEIILRVYRTEDRLGITVADTGSGMKPEVLECLKTGRPFVDAVGQRHIGVWNCRRRMEVFYNEPPKIEITSNSEGTAIFLDVPFQMEDRT